MATADDTASKFKTKLSAAEIFASRKSVAMLALGASAGLPIMLVYQVLSAWLREADVSRSAIGFFVWVGFAYSLKFLWAPLIDRTRIPGFSDWLGNRRGWTLFAILGTALAMWSMSVQDPSTDLAGVAVAAVLIAFASATLDICVDAWRVDSGLNAEQASLSAIYQLGYRFGMIAAVSGGLFLADIGGFGLTYLVLGVLAAVGASTPLWAPQTATEAKSERDNRGKQRNISGMLLGVSIIIALIIGGWTGLGIFGLGLIAYARLKTEQNFVSEASPYKVGNTQSTVVHVFKGLATLALVSAFIYIGMMEKIDDGPAIVGFLRDRGTELIGVFTWILSPLSESAQKRLGSGFLLFILSLPFLGSLWFLTLGRASLGRSTTYNIPIIGDLADVVRRLGWMALMVFAIVATYRISDTTMGVMAMPLYIDLGYDKSVIGGVKGAFGISILIVGAFAGGWWATRYGLAHSMIAGAILTVLTNLAFAWLATVETPRAIYLFVTIGADNIAAGFAGSVFIAFMSVVTNKQFSASQYALFSSLFAFYGKSLAGFSGVLADEIGYQSFFTVTALFGLPALLFVIYTKVTGFTDNITESAERGDRAVNLPSPVKAESPTEQVFD